MSDPMADFALDALSNTPGWDFETAPPTGQSRARDRRSWRREYEQEAAQDDEEFAAEMEHFFGDEQLEEGAS